MSRKNEEKRALVASLKARVDEKSPSPLLEVEVVSATVHANKLTRVVFRSKLRSADDDPEGAEIQPSLGAP